MKSKDAKLFLDTWVTKVKGYSTPVVSYDDAVHSVEFAEREIIGAAISAHRKSCPNWNNCKDRVSYTDCQVQCEYQKLFIRKLTSMTAQELINNNALANIEITGDQTVVFTEIALTAVKMAREEGANNLISQSVSNGQKKHQQGMDFMKHKAIEAFNETMIYYTSPACTKDEEALKYFRAYLDQELDSSCSEKPNDLICGNCDAFCECVMGPYGVDCNDPACPRFDDSSLSQLNNKGHE